MTLKTIFDKPVDRPIEGVIKTDDEASLRLEIEEYVLTNEVEKRLESFLDAYNNYEGANGVWVSGFFGSGKSHLLKMLALVMENREIDGSPALDLFLPKCGDNEILRGDLRRAVAIPSKSILFNIDQKADVISKTQIDALLAVFVKVFDEMCGYYGKQGHIAQFERDLDSRGLYEQFMSAYESAAGIGWQKGREQALLESANIAKAYARAIGDCGIGQLATFDLMFEGIRTALKSQIQRAIIQAEKHLESPFSIRLLKTLFLVKYVKEFKPTVRNLCVLMLDGFDQDLPALRKRVEEALDLLEQQTYVQRNGEFYEYLTDEEKDVEQEIKNTEVETSDVAAELEKIVFDHVIKHRKVRFDENGQDYPFTRKLDERLFGREYELCIHAVSPFHEFADNQMSLVMHSFGRDELLIVMPPDDRLVRDLLMYKRTEKYIRQNISVAQQEAIKRILTDKGFRNRERYAELQQRVRSLIAEAKLFVAGTEADIGSGDPQNRVLRGFHELVSRAYPNLRMLRGIAYTEKDIAKCLDNSQLSLFGDDDATLPESEQEMLAFIQSNNRGGVRTTLKNLVEKFERKPYGWHYAGVLCSLAKLCARGKVEARNDGNLLEDDELERALGNSHGHGNVVLEPQVEFTASQVRALKEFFEDFFDAPPQAGEAKALGKATGAAVQELMRQLAPLAAQAGQYPFLNALNPAIEKLEELAGKPYTWYLTELVRQEDAFLDMKEGVIDPVRKFMGGPQKGIFDSAREFVQAQEPNFAYIEGDDTVRVVAALADPECFKGNRMQQVKTQVEALQEKVSSRIEAEIAQAKETVAALKDRLCAMAEFAALNGEQQEQIAKPFDDFSADIERQKLIAVIRDTLRRFEESDYQRQLSMMTAWAQRQTYPDPTKDSGASQVKDGKKAPVEPETNIEYVPSRCVRVSFDKAWLADETDVDRYLQSMREALLKEIRKGKRIQI